MVRAGTLPNSPACVITNGIVEITLLPKLERTHSATPSVITYSDASNHKCCQRNDMMSSFCNFFIFLVFK